MNARWVLLALLFLGPARAIADSSAPYPDLVETSTGGLTAEQAAARAMEMSHSVAGQEAALREAAVRVDEAVIAFLPRVGVSGRYTRLSDLEAPQLTGEGGLVGTNAAPGTMNPPTVALPPLRFPVVLDNYSFAGSVVVPISDYALRISRASAAAISARKASELNALAAKAKARADARIAFYNWLRSQGAVTVAKKTLLDRRAHLDDARTLYSAGSVSKADVLRAEADMTLAEQLLSRSESLARVAGIALRLLLQWPEGTPLYPGERLTAPIPDLETTAEALVLSARTKRPELGAIDATLQALEEQRGLTRAAYFPSLVATADLLYANPNPRLVPQQEEFFVTWSAGLALSWSPNELLLATRQMEAQAARIGQLDAQRAQLADAMTLEVTQAYEEFTVARFAIDASQRQIVAAEEGYRVARAQYRAGRMSSSGLEAVETQLTLARLGLLNAHADRRVARARIDYASGEEASRIGRP